MSRNPKLGRPAKYDWELFTNGETHVLREGVDFECTAESFVILVRRTARVRRIAVDVSRLTEDGHSLVRVRFFIPEDCSASAV